MLCGAVMGERCSQCGAEATPDCHVSGWFWCAEHGPFEAGEGGESHGVCAKCEPAWRARALTRMPLAGGAS
jgi:hypothetical protein